MRRTNKGRGFPLPSPLLALMHSRCQCVRHGSQRGTEENVPLPRLKTVVGLKLGFGGARSPHTPPGSPQAPQLVYIWYFNREGGRGGRGTPTTHREMSQCYTPDVSALHVAWGVDARPPRPRPGGCVPPSLPSPVAAYGLVLRGARPRRGSPPITAHSPCPVLLPPSR